MLIRIPRSARSRGERTYAQLVLRVLPKARVGTFEGPVFRCGDQVDESELRPTPEYPATPLLIEYAGQDRAGGAHYRANGFGGRCLRDIHILWRFDPARKEWNEIARTLSQGHEWVMHLAPIVRREIGRDAPAVNFVELAGAVSTRVLAVLDREMDLLEDEGRDRVMSFLYDAFTARLVEHEPPLRAY